MSHVSNDQRVIEGQPPVVRSPLSPRVMAPKLVLALLVVFGLWRSLQITLSTWGPDADAADLAMLWFGVREHGVGFLRSWYYTQDNWLLTLVPPAFAAFAVLDAKPILVVLSGWMIFVGCVVLSVALARLIFPKRYATAVGMLLLLCNTNILGQAGFFTYSIEHNSSLLIGLAGLISVIKWIRSGAYVWLVLCFILYLVGGISDPWIKAAFVLPVLIAAVLCTLMPRDSIDRRRLASASIAILLAGGLAQTKLLGCLGFLPNDKLLLADWSQLNGNFIAFCDAIALFFNPVPGMSKAWAIPDACICLSLGGLLALALYRLVQDFKHLTLEQTLVSMTMAISCGIVTLAFLIGVWQNTYVAPRFMVNVYVFLPLLICLGLLRARRHNIVLHFITSAFALMIVTASVSTDMALWRHWPKSLQTLGTVELATFLKEHGLHYGYGSYWGTQANGVSWISRGDVLIRPIQFSSRTGHISARTAQTSLLWYNRFDHVGAERTSFVIVGTDSENCPNLDICLNGIQDQFGPAERVLAYGDARVLVWSHDLKLPRPPLPGSIE